MAPLRVVLVLRIAPLLLVACGLVEAAPLVAPSGPVAPSGLAATMDPGEGAIVHDDGLRRSPPPEALRRRVYSVVPSFVRWSWRAELSFPVDRVALVGSPPPLPGQRFVLFDEGGPFGLVEATGERCPPGHDDCVVCEVDDPARRHWARYVGAPPPGPPRWGYALGPFAAGEPLPEPRSVEGSWQSRGLWRLRAEADLDGDGTVDRVRALHDCRPGRPNHPRCRMQAETWRLHDGRWFAEPRLLSSPTPMHLLSLGLPEVFPGGEVCDDRVVVRRVRRGRAARRLRDRDASRRGGNAPACGRSASLVPYRWGSMSGPRPPGAYEAAPAGVGARRRSRARRGPIARAKDLRRKELVVRVGCADARGGAGRRSPVGCHCTFVPGGRRRRRRIPQLP